MIADMRSVALTIERSMIQASQNIESIPTDVIIGFSSSQLISDNTTTQYLRTPGTTITMNEIDEMVKKVEKNSFERVRKKAKEAHGMIHDDLKLVSSTITAIEVDGRAITNPIGFDGKKVRLSILNIFAPAGEFNIVRSVSSHIGKNIISLIPIPLVFPKILEKTDYGGQTACIVDIGLMHTSIVCIRDNRTIALETFPFGSEMLVQLLENQYKELTALQIEHMLSNDEYNNQKEESVIEFFSYITDMIQIFIRENTQEFDMNYIFCHGGIFESEGIKKIFLQKIHEQYNNTIKIQRFSDVLDCDVDEVITR
jgi:cell division ATPase FtsA